MLLYCMGPEDKPMFTFHLQEIFLLNKFLHWSNEKLLIQETLYIKMFH